MGWTWTQRDSVRNWKGAASSSDGLILYAIVNGGYIYSSINGGINWSQTGSASKNWNEIDCTADGIIIVAADDADVYRSIDSGTSWPVLYAGSNAVAISDNGNNIVVGSTSNGGNDRISTNAGVDWFNGTSSGFFKGDAAVISGNGVYMIVAHSQGGSWYSTNSGASWSGPIFGGGFGDDAGGSYDGQYFAVAVGAVGINNNYLDSGSWVYPTGLFGFSGAAISSDGQYVVAVRNPGYIYISDDYGLSWVSNTDAGSRAWSGVAMSADGSRIVATVNGGYIYTGVFESALAPDKTSYRYG